MDDTVEENLLYTLADILGSYNLKAERAWVEHFHPNPNLPLRRQVNEYLRLQLGRMPVDTTSQRECLSDHTPTPDYLRHFRTHVAPLIARHGLPDWNW